MCTSGIVFKNKTIGKKTMEDNALCVLAVFISTKTMVSSLFAVISWSENELELWWISQYLYTLGVT